MHGVETFVLESQRRNHWKVGQTYDRVGYTNNDGLDRQGMKSYCSTVQADILRALDGTHASEGNTKYTYVCTKTNHLGKIQDREKSEIRVCD